MNFKRIVALAIAGALLAAQPAAAGEDAKRFKEVETWEGDFSFEIVTTGTPPRAWKSRFSRRSKAASP